MLNMIHSPKAFLFSFRCISLSVGQLETMRVLTTHFCRRLWGENTQRISTSRHSTAINRTLDPPAEFCWIQMAIDKKGKRSDECLKYCPTAVLCAVLILDLLMDPLRPYHALSLQKGESIPFALIFGSNYTSLMPPPFKSTQRRLPYDAPTWASKCQPSPGIFWLTSHFF